MRAKPLAVATAVLLAAAWMYATPWFAFDRLRAAVHARDAGRIAAEIDFEALRASLKRTLTVEFVPAGAAAGPGDPLASLGTSIATALIDPLVEGFITPDGLALLLRGEPPHAGLASTTAAAESRDDGVDIASGYESLDRFVAHAKRRGEGGRGVDFVFERAGLAAWRLTGIRLPGG